MRVRPTADRKAAMESRQLKLAAIFAVIVAASLIYGFVAHQPGITQFGVGCIAGLALCLAPIALRRMRSSGMAKRSTP